MKKQLLKFIDRTFGSLLTCLLTAPRSQPLRAPNKILIIRPGGIGDAVHLLPAINMLRKNFPEAVIDILAEKRNGAVFSLTHDVTTVFHYDNFPELLRIFKGRYDLVIDTEQWHHLSAVIARFVGASATIGYATNERKKLFTHAVQYSHDDYEAGSFCNLLDPLSIVSQADFSSPYLAAPVSALENAVKLLGELTKRPFVTLFPGSSIPERRWGVLNFIGLAEKLYGKSIPFVVIGGREDCSGGDRIAARGYGLNLAGKTSLLETAALIDLSSLLISGDSGILHIGVGLGKPTISLFGPGLAKKWAPRGDNHIVINKCLPCSPCTMFGTTPPCPINAKCMADISVDEVIAAVEKLLRSTASNIGRADGDRDGEQTP